MRGKRARSSLRGRPDSIRAKIVMIVVLSILPLNLLVILSTQASINVVRRQAVSSIGSTANLYMQQLDNRVFSVNYYFYDLLDNNADFIRLSQQRGDDAYRLAQTRVAQRFNTAISTTASADGLFYFAENLDDFTLTLPAATLSLSAAELRALRAELEGALRAGIDAGMERWSLKEIGGMRWLVCVGHSRSFHYGALISLNAVREQIARTIPYETLEIAIDDAEARENPARLSVTSDSARTGTRFHLSVASSEITRTLPLMQRISGALAFGYLLLIPVLLAFLNHLLIRPLNKIKSAMLRLKDGDRDYRISAHRYASEFRSINQSFNDMADNIERLKIENYEKELERERMELLNLQLHIRPHFLLNTFNLIFSLAQMKEYAAIQQMTLYLSNYFRYIFRSGRDLEPFRQEYSLIREYLEISARRYPGCFTARYDIQEEALDVDVPPLLIHSFVENIINHAIKIGSQIHVDIQAEVAEGWASFTVADDGAGIPKEDVERINRAEFDGGEGGRVHVGLSNSYQRMRHFYGEQSSLRVESAPGEGTRLTIRFPHQPKEDAP